MGGASVAAPDWADRFLLDDPLSAEGRMIGDAARAYAQDRPRPAVIETFSDGNTDPEIFRDMGALILGSAVTGIPAV